jgi:glutathione synthase/RimK-type ligase-like ATP-grasp enzyme
MKKLGIIGNSESHEVKNLVESAAPFFDAIIMINPRDLSFSFVRGESKIIIMHGTTDISDLSALFVRGTAKYPQETSILAKSLKSNGCFIVDGINRFCGNKPSKIKTTVSRFVRDIGSTSHFALNKKMAIQLVETLSLPLVVKPVFGSEGNGVKLLQTNDSVLEYINEFNFDVPILFQEKIDIVKEYRIMVVGGKAIGMFNKTAADGEITANHARGATWNQEWDDNLVNWVLDSVSNKGLLGVDAAIDSNGVYYIIEENRRPSYGSTIDVGKYLVQYILENISTDSSVVDLPHAEDKVYCKNCGNYSKKTFTYLRTVENQSIFICHMCNKETEIEIRG